MPSCLKLNYDPIQNVTAVKRAVTSKGYMYNENGVRLISQENGDLNKLKDNIIKVLDNTFSWTSDEAKQLLIRDLGTIFDLYLTNPKVDSITKQNLKTLHNLLVQEIGIVSDLQDNVQDETDTEQTTNKENSEEFKNSEKIKDFERSIYGTATSAKNYRQLLFERDLSKMCIVDVDNNTIVTGNADLNQNIVNQKNRYYQNILAFLESAGLSSDAFPKKMFEKGVLQKNYIQALNVFYKYLNDNKANLSEQLRIGWKNTIKGEESLLYNAVNSYVNLFYFDELIKNTLGKTIVIDKDLEGFEVDGHFNKYTFNDRVAELAKGWETQEYRDALEDIAKFSKLLIQSIPMFSRKTRKQSPSNVTMVGFTNAFTNIFAAIQYRNSTGAKVDNDLLDCVYNMHDNPDKYIKQLLKELFTTKKNSIENFIHYGITSYDADVLYSVYNYVYGDTNSINAVEIDRLSKNFSNGQYPLVQCINGVVDRTMQMNYLQSTVDPDGNTYVSVKKKFHSRQREYNTRNSINNQVIARDSSLRQELQDKYQIEPSKNDIGSWTFTINNQSYTVKSGSAAKIVLTSDNLVVEGEIPEINLSDQAIVQALLSEDEQYLTPELFQFKNILKFIQDNLSPIKILTETGLDRLALMESIKESGSKTAVSILLAAAAKSAVVNSIYLDYENLGNTDKSFYKYVTGRFPALRIENLEETQIRNLFSQGKGTKNLLAVRVSDDWVDLYVTADATINGDVSKAVTKDLFGNSVANYSTSFMGGNLPYYLRQAFNAPNSVQGKLLFAKQSNLVSGVVVNTDSEAKGGIKKSVKEMKTGELMYQSIFHNFWETFLSDTKSQLHGQYITQPTTYSDKTKIVSYMVNALKEINEGIAGAGRELRPYLGKTLAELTTEETVLLYGDTLGDFYTQAYNNTINKYAKMFGVNPNLEEVLTKIEEINNNDLIRNKEDYITKLAKTNGIDLQLYSDYRMDGGKIRFNELLDYYANYLFKFDGKGYPNLGVKLYSEKINFVNALLESNTILYTKYFDGKNNAIGDIIQQLFPTSYTEGKNKNFENLYKSLNPKQGENLQSKFINTWVREDKLILAKELDPDGNVITEYVYGDLIPSDAIIEINPLLEKYFFTDSLIANNLRLSLTGSEIAHPAKGAKLLNVADRLQKGFTSEYLKNIANIESKSQGAQLKRNVIIPATLQYLQQNTLNGVPKKLRIAVLRDLGVNVFNFRGDMQNIDSMDGSAFTTAYTSILENNSLQDQKVGENKKSIMHSNTYLTGGAVLGKWATFALTNELISQSLNSNVNLYNLVKKLTNVQWHINGQLNSEFIDVEKMQGNMIDLVRGRGYHTNIPLNFANDILRGKQLFYQDYAEISRDGKFVRKINQVRQIVDFGREDGIYYTVEQNVNMLPGKGVSPQGGTYKMYHLFDANSNHIKLTEEEYNALEDKSMYHTINSLFELHQAMGGLNSVEAEDGRWVISEASNYAVVNFMNNVSVRQTNNTKDFSQDNYYQPLKDAQIAYAANNSSIKNGASNINQASSWTKPWEEEKQLNYMTITSDGLGVQMDADHEADESLLTEFSQVISALDAGGRLHSVAKQVYKDLGAVALQASALEVDALQSFVDNLITKGKEEAVSELYDIIGRTIINNFKQNNQASLADEIIAAIQNRFDENFSHELDELKIPFSDPGIYGSMLSTFVSNINGKSVKRKYPGSGYVMSPSYGFMQLWDINGIPHQFEDIFNLANKGDVRKNPLESYTQYKQRVVKEYLESLQAQQPARDRMEFSPNEKVRVVLTDTEGNIHQIQVDLSSPTDYVIFKQDYWKYLVVGKLGLDGELITTEMLDNSTIQFFNDITLGRDLAPARITWEDPNGGFHNIFDEQPIRDSFTGVLTYTNESGETKEVVIPAAWAEKISKGKMNPSGFIQSMFGETITEYSAKLNTPNRVAIQAVFDNLHKGIINGYEVKNLQVKAAEIIMSSMNRSKYPTHTSLASAISNPQSFRINYPFEINGPDGYDLAFIKQNGRHSYVTFGEVTANVNDINSPQEIKWSHIKPIPKKDSKGQLTGDGSVIYAIDKDSTLLFPIGISKKVKNLRWSESGQVIDKQGNPVEGEFIRGKNGEVQQVIYFVKKYNIYQQNKDKFGRTKLLKHTLYKIDLDALTNNGWSSEDLADILSKLYGQEAFAEFRVNSKTKFKNRLLKTIPNLNFDNANLAMLVQNKLYNLLQRDEFDEKAYQMAIKEYSGRQNTAMYSSFLRQLEVISSRIPAQTLQSFMQMQCVGYIQNKKNICYVTPWQTYLQGSDYDIDKSYIMGSEINYNGIYVGWSPLFDYTSLGTLKASELLPFPTGKTLNLTNNNKNLDISNYIVRLSQHIPSNSDTYETDRIETLKIQTELLQLINDLAQGNHYNVYVDPEIIKQVGEDVVLTLIENLNRHQRYQIPAELKESAYKNSVSSKINRIINDVRNMDSAYSPIEMGHIRPKDSSAKIMSLMNPATKFIMQVQNMVGKNVIGIAAVGEKIFFNLTYYWNEQLRTGQDLNYLVFSHNYSRIEGRAAANETQKELSEKIRSFMKNNPSQEEIDKFVEDTRFKLMTEGKKINPTQVTKNKLANINLDFDGVESFQNLVNEINDIFEETKKELPEEETTSEIFQNRLHEKIRAAHDGESQADLYISELLSAATDNAKELILAQINAGTDLAGNYLYLLTLGFEIKDIVAFMTSPTLSVISSLSEFNMYNDYIEPLNIENIVKLLQGDETVLYGYGKSPLGTQLVYDAKIENPTGEDIKEQFRNYLKGRVLGTEKRSAKQITGGDQAISDFIDIIVSRIRQNLNPLNPEISYNNYMQDLDEFSIISRQAREASNLGNVLLGMNQGLPSSKVALLNKIRQIQSLVSKREEQLGITKNWIKDIQKELKEKSLNYPEDIVQSELFQAKVSELLTANPELESGKLPSTQPGAIQNILVSAITRGLATEFDARVWLTNESYRKATKQYYNIIKDTWNVFDVVDKVPQFNSLIKLLGLVYQADKELALKSRVVDNIHRKLLKDGRYLDDYKLEQIIRYVDDRLIVSWLENEIGSSFIIPIEEGAKYFDINGDLETSPTIIAQDMTTSEGRATFKYIMEKHIIPRLQNQGLKNIEIVNGKPQYTNEILDLSTNKFINGLVLVQDNQGVPFYKLDIDMMSIDASTANQEKFQDYLDGLLALKNIQYAGHPLSDWFMMYNFYVHKNNYGQDRMTTIFRSFIQQVPEDSLIRSYYKYVGDADYSSSDDVIQNLGINYEDLNIAMAPFVSENRERFSKEPVIKQSKDGFVIYKRKNKSGTYVEIPRYPNRKLVGDIETKKDNARKTNAIEYFMMWSPNQENIDYFTRKLRSDNIQDVLEALTVLQSQGIVQINISDCT